MNHETVLQTVLDRGWRLEDLHESAEILAHMNSCTACREALEEYDVIRAALEPSRELEESQFVEAALPGLERESQKWARPAEFKSNWSRWRLGGAIAAGIALLLTG